MIFQCFDWWCQKSSKATKKLDAVLTALPVFSSWQMKCLGQRSNGPTVSSDHKIFYHLVSKSSTWFTVNTSPSRLMFFLHLWLFLCHFGKTWGQQLLYSQGVPPQPCSSFIPVPFVPVLDKLAAVLYVYEGFSVSWTGPCFLPLICSGQSSFGGDICLHDGNFLLLFGQSTVLF